MRFLPGNVILIKGQRVGKARERNTRKFSRFIHQYLLLVFAVILDFPKDFFPENLSIYFRRRVKPETRSAKIRAGCLPGSKLLNFRRRFEFSWFVQFPGRFRRQGPEVKSREFPFPVLTWPAIPFSRVDDFTRRQDGLSIFVCRMRRPGASLKINRAAN